MYREWRPKLYFFSVRRDVFPAIDAVPLKQSAFNLTPLRGEYIGDDDFVSVEVRAYVDKTADGLAHAEPSLSFHRVSCFDLAS